MGGVERKWGGNWGGRELRAEVGGERKWGRELGAADGGERKWGREGGNWGGGVNWGRKLGGGGAEVAGIGEGEN